MNRTLCVLILAILFVLGGCYASSPEMVVDTRPKTIMPGTVAPDDVPSPVAALDEPAGIITLPDVLALAVSRNPGLGVFPYEFRAADARALQAGLRRNPEFELEIEEFAGSGARGGFDAAETTVRIGQPIELGGKRAKRLRVAQLDKELTQWDYESARLDVMREATQAFIGVVAAQDRVALARQLVDLSQQAHAAVAQRTEAGRDPPVDELRASVALSTTRIELQKAEKALRTARQNLAAVWGGKNAVFERAADGPDAVAPPAIPQDTAAAIAGNPDVARWETQERRQRAALRLEQANAAPDVTFGGGVRRFEETDDAAVVFDLAAPLPLFDRNQGGIRAALAALGKTRRQYESVQVRTLAALSEAIGALMAAHEEVVVLKNDVLPKAGQAFAAAQEGYRQGKFDYLYVLDTQRTLFETQAGYIDAVEAYRKAQADVTRLVGGSLNAADRKPSSGSLAEPLSQEQSHDE